MDTLHIISFNTLVITLTPVSLLHPFKDQETEAQGITSSKEPRNEWQEDQDWNPGHLAPRESGF